MQLSDSTIKSFTWNRMVGFKFLLKLIADDFTTLNFWKWWTQHQYFCISCNQIGYGAQYLCDAEIQAASMFLPVSFSQSFNPTKIQRKSQQHPPLRSSN
jgi:hypothetical protein